MPKAALVLTLMLIASGASAEPPDPMGPRMVAPDGSVVTLDSTFGAQPLVVNIWATWCGPCREEMPSLAALDQWLERRGGRVLLVAAEQSPPEVVNKVLHERFGVTSLESYVDRAGLVTAAFGVEVYPTTIILSHDGTVLEVIEGASDWNDPSMQTHLRQWLIPDP